MAMNATILKLELQISDMNRHYYGSHSLTVALHPSETPERLMIRVVAFALHASESLSFTKGISTEDEPDLWDKDLSGQIMTWVDLGQPEEKRTKKACGRAQEVFIYTYQPRNSGPWWDKSKAKLERFDKLTVTRIDTASSTTLDDICEKNMDLQCSIDGETVYLRSEDKEVELTLVKLKDKATS